MITFKKYFTEGVEGTADLKAMYNRFNQQLFNNELPKITVKWTNSNRTPGEVQAVFLTSQTSKIGPLMGRVKNWKFLGISKKFDLDEDTLEGIFIHEMIHVWLLHTGIGKTSGRDKMHGYEFKQKLNQLQLLTKVVIPEKETDIKPSTMNKAKQVGYIWLNQSGKNFVVKASVKMIQSNLTSAESHFMRYFDGLNSSTNFVEIGIATTNAFETKKGIRKIPFNGWSSMTDDEIKSATKDSKILWRKEK